MVPTARTASGRRIGTTRGARRAWTAPGRWPRSSGSRSAERGRPRGRSPIAATTPASCAARARRSAARPDDHQRGGRTSSTTRTRAGAAAGPASARRTATGRPEPDANRTAADASDPIAAGRARPTGPGRRHRCATAAPSGVAGVGRDARVPVTGSGPVTASPRGTRGARPRGTRSGARRSRRTATGPSSSRRRRRRAPTSACGCRGRRGPSRRRWRA